MMGGIRASNGGESNSARNAMGPVDPGEYMIWMSNKSLKPLDVQRPTLSPTTSTVPPALPTPTPEMPWSASFGGSLCAVLCIVGSYSPPASVSIGIGAGPKMGWAGEMGGSLGPSSGGYISAGCEAAIGPVGAGLNGTLSQGGFSGGGTLSFGATAGCNAAVGYTFDFGG